MLNNHKKLSCFLKAIIIIAAAIGTFLSVYSSRDSFMGGANVFMYFTIQSNIGIAIIAAIGAYYLSKDRAGKVWAVIKFVGTVSITLTGIVFCFVLAPTLGDEAWVPKNILTHVVVPIVSIVDFFIVGKWFSISRKKIIFVIIPPLLYAIFAGVAYVNGWQFSEGVTYPYFFLNWGSKAGAVGFTNELPFMGCVWWIVAIFIFLMLVGLLYLTILKKTNKGVAKDKEMVMESIHQVTIDTDKCIGCGLCKSDCVGCDIEIVDGKAIAHGKSCILCGHCEAICPENAVKITGFDDEIEEFDEQTRLDPKQLLDAIKTRRTIRQFTDKKISQDIIDMIFEAGRMAPTGTNSQGTSYVLLDEKKHECEAVAVGMFSKLIKAGKAIIPQLSSMEIGENFFFKRAPIVIVIFGKDKVSASLAAENMTFMAEACGLGVLFSGLFTGCVNMSSKIRKIMGVARKPKAVTTLVIGYPAVKYKRTPHRNPLKLIKA